MESLKLPGRIFQLPSAGLFYGKGVLAPQIENAEIHFRAMSAMDEIHLKNPDLLFSGTALNEILLHCSEGIAQPDKLLAQDVSAIMVYLRILTYGPSFEFLATHSCENAKEHSYVADLERIISEIKYLTTDDFANRFTVRLQNGQVVKFHPYLYKTIMDIVRKNHNKERLTVEERKENLREMMMATISSVDEITDPQHIFEWIQAIPQPMINRISEALDKASDWGVTTKWECTCPECGEKFLVDLPTDPMSFFIE